MRQTPEFGELVDQMRSMLNARAQGILAGRAAQFAHVYGDWMIGAISLTDGQVRALERWLGLIGAGGDGNVGQQQAQVMTVNVYPKGTEPEDNGAAGP